MVAAASGWTSEGARTVLAARGLELVEESTVARHRAPAQSACRSCSSSSAWWHGCWWVARLRRLKPSGARWRRSPAPSSTDGSRTPGGTDELARLAATMNEMLGRLERGQSRQRQLVADTSHELRSPIASIRQHAEVALAHPERTTASELAETVLAESLRLARLVDDLLLLARADEHTLALRATIARPRRPRRSMPRALCAGTGTSRSTRPEFPAAGSVAIRTDCGAWSPTLPRTRLVTHAGASPSRSSRMATRSGSGWRTMARGSRQPIAIASSSASCASTPRGLATPAAAGSGWRSWRSSSEAHEGSTVIGESALGGTMVEVRLPRATD